MPTDFQIDFNCQQCGACCNRPGLVFLTLQDIFNLQKHFNLDMDSLHARYLDIYQRQYILREHPEGGCIFAHQADKRCPIYAVRPEQCRTYPFWPSVQDSLAWYEQESKTCPGIKIIRDR